MATKTKRPQPASENAQAALAAIEDAASKAERGATTLRDRLREQDEQISDLEVQVETLRAQAEADTRRAAEAYERDVTALKTQLSAANEKLRKVGAMLA